MRNIGADTRARKRAIAKSADEHAVPSMPV